MIKKTAEEYIKEAKKLFKESPEGTIITLPIETIAIMRMLDDLRDEVNKLVELEKIYKALNDVGLGEDLEFTPEFVNKMIKVINKKYSKK